MVIQQFNRLIRNKWFWGAFVFFVVFCFCFDSLFSDSSKKETDVQQFGTLGKAPNPSEPVDGNLYSQCREDIDLWLRLGNAKHTGDENLLAWKLYAAQKVAEKNAFRLSNESLARYAMKVLQARPGELTPDEYERMVVERLGMTLERFDAFCRHGLIAEMVGVADYPPVGNLRYMVKNSLADAEIWPSRMETMQAVYDETDTYTVRYVDFAQTPAEGAAVKMTDALLKEWYEKNRQTLALPDLYRIRYIAVDATKPEDIAKCTVTEQEISDYYGAHGNEFAMTRTYTNGTDLASITNQPYVVATTDDKGNTTVKSKKPIEEVKDTIRAKLGQQKNVRRLKEALTQSVNADLKGKSVDGRLAEVAAAYGKPSVKTSGWFSKGNDTPVEGFMVSADTIIPDVAKLPSRLKYLTLDKEYPLFRFTVVNSDSKVYVVELTDRKPAHVPTMEECRGKVDGLVLAAAREQAFKDKVNAVIAKGAAAVLATPGASTNLTFSLTGNAGVPQDVIRAAISLGKGQVSDIVPAGTGKAKVVVCIDRKPTQFGRDLKDQAVRGVEQSILFQRRMAGQGWGEDYLDYVGFTPGAQNGIVKTVQE